MPRRRTAGPCSSSARRRLPLELAVEQFELVRLQRPDGCEIVGPLDAGVAEMGQRDAARVADRGVSAGEVDRREVGDAFVSVDVGEQYLATPDGAVVAVARAVERDADDPLVRVALVLGHHGRDVGVVVLHLDDPIGVVGARPTWRSRTRGGRRRPRPPA